MRTILTALVTAALTGCAGPQDRPALTVTPVPATRTDCPLTVGFGSYAMGIDRSTYDAVEALLARDAGVTGVEQQRWGREGEITLCALVRSDGDAARLFGRVKALFPADPRGPLSVVTRGGLSFEVSRTR